MPLYAPRVKLRVHLDRPADARALAALRRAVPDLANQSLATLRRRLERHPWFVVEAADLEGLVAAGLRVERVPVCDYETLVACLPPPFAGWSDASPRAEILFLPSFDPEVMIRLAEGTVQLCTMSAPLGSSRFGISRWLIGDCDPPPPIEQPLDAVAESAIADALLSKVDALRPRRAEAVCDGMGVVVRTDRRDVYFATPGPDRAPVAHRWLTATLDETLRALPVTQPHVQRLRRYLG